MSKKLFIGNCDFNLDDTALQTFIESTGIQVSSVRIIRDRETGRSRGFGFAELAETEDLENAIQTLNGKEVEGRPLTVNEAREQRPRQGGGFGGGRSRGGFRGGRNQQSNW